MILLRDVKKHLAKLLKKRLVFALLFGLVAVSILLFVDAAEDNSYIEPESSSISGNASYVGDGNASGGAAVIFSGSTSSTFPLKVSGNGRYLVDQANQSFLYTADTSWTLLSKLTVADARRYIDTRKAQGFNAIQTNLIAWYRFESGARGAAFSGSMTSPIESYWAGVDQIIDYANSQQMVLSVGIMWLASNGGYANASAPSSGEFTQYATWVGNRYKNKPNIMWFLGGDEEISVLTNLSRVGAQALRAADPNHLITYHPRSNSYSFRNEAWMGYNSFQNNSNSFPYPYSLVRDGYNLTPTKPVLDSEPAYEPRTCCGTDRDTSSQENRRSGWWAVLAGALGVVYGGPEYGSWNIGDNGIIDWNGTNREPPKHTGNIRKILEKIAWYKLVPDWNNTAVTGGRGSYNNTDYAIAGRASDGSHIALYMPTSRAVTVNMSQLSGTVYARWFDPTTGNATGTALTYPNSGSQSFTPPGNNSGGDSDWVLLLSTSPIN